MIILLEVILWVGIARAFMWLGVKVYKNNEPF
mgnify:FL=1|jgi:hypothetical protein